MTRITDLAQTLAPRRLSPCGHLFHGGPSFAERLESGESARAQIANRALSFSEVGILGLHYANQGNDAPPVPLASQKVLPQDLAQTGPAIKQPVAVQASSYHTMPTSVADVSVFHGKLSEPQSLTHMAHSACVAGNAPAAISQTETECPATDIGPGLAKSFHNLLAEKRPAARLHLSIKEMPDGITVICNGDMPDDGFLQDISLVSQQTAEDFGVTIRSLVVNGKKRPSFD